MIESEATDADRWEGGTQGRILVVDDEPRLLSLLMRVMRANGFDVQCAFGATRGLELLDPKCNLELLSEVWGYSFDQRTNVVDVYVRRLRAKLGDQVVETVRSVGYSCGVL